MVKRKHILTILRQSLYLVCSSWSATFFRDEGAVTMGLKNFGSLSWGDILGSLFVVFSSAIEGGENLGRKAQVEGDAKLLALQSNKAGNIWLSKKGK